MKLLFDHNLPPRLAQSLADLFPESRHVYPLGLALASDREICDFAREHGFAIVAKDADLRTSHLRSDTDRKWSGYAVVICSVEEVENLLRQQSAAILAYGEDRQARTLVLL